MTTTTNTPLSTTSTTAGRLPSRWPAIVRIAAAVASLFVAILVPQYTLLAPFAGRVEDGSAAGIALWSLSMLATMGIAVLIVHLLMRYVDRERLAAAGWLWTRHSGRFLAAGLVTAAGLNVVLGSVLTRAGLLREVSPPSYGVVMTIIGGLLLAFPFQGIPEELLFRGYLMRTLGRRPLVATAISVLTFTAIHLLSSGGQQNALERVLYLVMPLGMGLAGAGFVLKTRSLWGAVGIHAGVHVGTLIGGFLGSGNGPVWWVTLGLALSVVGIGLILSWWRDPDRSAEIRFDR